jgi:hypothetical protein
MTEATNPNADVAALCRTVRDVASLAYDADVALATLLHDARLAAITVYPAKGAADRRARQHCVDKLAKELEEYRMMRLRKLDRDHILAGAAYDSTVAARTHTARVPA